MPELPEVETVRAGIVEYALGAEIESVVVHDIRSIRRYAGDAHQFVEELTGAVIVDAARHHATVRQVELKRFLIFHRFRRR